MILSEKLSSDAGRPVLFMLGLLEVGAIALLVAVLLLAVVGQDFAFEALRSQPLASRLPATAGTPLVSCW